MAQFPFGRSRSSGSGSGKYLQLTLYIIIINVGIFILANINANVMSYLALVPFEVVDQGMFWQPFTYMFLHVGTWHLVFNMLTLFFFGFTLERQMGSGAYAVFYLVAGVGSGLLSLVSYLITGSMGTALYGASGAIMALLVAFACFFPHSSILLFGILPIRGPFLVLGYTVIEIIMAFVDRNSGVAHLTHLFGLAIGYFYMVIRYRLDLVKILLNRD